MDVSESGYTAFDRGAGGPARDRDANARPQPADGAERREGPPRTDAGTILIHWITAIAMFTSLLTGLRIAADAPDAVISRALAPILPTGEIWTWHFAAGLTLFFTATAYLLYLRRSGLKRRVALKKLRVLQLQAGPRLRWGAINVALYWLLYALIVVLTATGVLLYTGRGGWLVTVHTLSAFAVMGYIVAHLVSHFAYGGLDQILRVFRPAPLVRTRATRRWPLAAAIVVGIVVAAGIAWSDFGTRDTLRIVRVDTPPVLDGRLDDPAWAAVRPVVVHTQQGVNLGGTGESTVEIRAVHDDEKVYFAFRWEDPTRSLRRVPMVKREDGWHLMASGVDIAEVNDFYEDKIAIGIARSQTFGNGESTHLGAKPLADKPASLHGRGYHYTTDDSLIDVWQWKATRGGHLGQVDDQYFGGPRDTTPDEAAGKARYQAGYWNDPGRSFYSYNYVGEPPGGYRGPIELKRLPKDWQATQDALGTVSFNPDTSDDEGSRWWMTEAESVPYSAELDARIPVGTVLPGVLIMGEYEGDRADVVGVPHWEDGHWTLELSRALRTGSEYDHDFVPGEDLFMWVNVFDHTQTRHSRHVRPVRLRLE